MSLSRSTGERITDIRSVLTLLFLFSTVSLPFLTVRAITADGTIIRVPTDFPTIQQAINAAQNGSTILVSSGTYYEHLTVNKTVTLLGASKEDTIVDGSNSSDVVIITGDNVFFNGFTVRNSSKFTSGIVLTHSEGSIVTGNIVTHNGWDGIRLDKSGNNTVSNNIVSSTIGLTVGLISGSGITLYLSRNNTLSDNVITNSLVAGVDLDMSDSNLIMRNTLENNYALTVNAHSSNNNTFFRNNFVHNFQSIWQYSSNNTWSMHGEGNYWDDYIGLDDGTDGRTAGDGIGDTDLPWHGVDDYPLISPVNPLKVSWDDQAFPVSLLSNSTVSAFVFDQPNKKITFSVLGPANTTGYFNVSMPVELLSGQWKIFLDGADATAQANISENQTHTTVYLNYDHSTHNIQIVGTHVIPEYPTTTTVLLTTLLALTLAALIVRKNGANQPCQTRSASQHCASCNL